MIKILIKLRNVPVPKGPSSGNTSGLAKVTTTFYVLCWSFIGIFSILLCVNMF